MNSKGIKRIHHITALVLTTAILFFLFFQINKRSPFVESNPFAGDPYDAVGSIAIQLALLISLLSYARVLRCREDPCQGKERLILHGDILALAAIFITLCSDVVAEFVQPMPPSLWSKILIIELGDMFLLTIICGLAMWVIFRGMPTPLPQPNLCPADAIDDLWSLVRVPVLKAGAFIPPPIIEWVKRFNSDRLFARLKWLSPSNHPWRFPSAVGLLVGILIIIAQFQEGLPPSLAVGLLVMGIFISVEFVAIMVGFALFGVYLGLRPTLSSKN